MEVVDLSHETKHHRHAWLEWLGIEAPPAEADDWVPVARAMHVDDPETGSSAVGAGLVKELEAAGVAARQRLYEFYEVGFSGGVSVSGFAPASGMMRAVAVMVHERDLAQAVPIANKVKATLEVRTGISDEELTRQALEAGPPPPE